MRGKGTDQSSPVLQSGDPLLMFIKKAVRSPPLDAGVKNANGCRKRIDALFQIFLQCTWRNRRD